jgi:FkbM family methyltransferase
MTVATELSDYPTMPPRDALRKVALKAINLIFLSRGFKLPPYFSLRDRYETLLHWPEPDVRHLCRRLLRKGMTVVDVGANIGFLTRHFSRLVGPGGKVFAFEPDPLNFRFLEFNTLARKNVERAQMAVSDNAKPAWLHLNATSGAGNSLVGQTHSFESVPVSCVSLDDFIKSHGNPQVDLIKIDVEGAEVKVLQGMKQTISRLPDLQIIVEHCPKNLETAGIKSDAVYTALKTLDLGITAIRENGSLKNVAVFKDLEPRLNRQGYVNLLCSRGKLNES